MPRKLFNHENYLAHEDASKPFLECEEELLLIVLAQKGIKAKEVLDIRRLKDAKKLNGKLEKIVDTGEEARRTLITRNLRLITSMANMYVGKSPYLEQSDLIDEAVLGFSYAIKKFDITRGFRLSTYSTWWMRQYLQGALRNQGQAVHVPVHLLEGVAKLQSIKKWFRETFNRDPLVNEIAFFMDKPVYYVVRLEKAGQKISSLDASMTEDGKQSFADLIYDKSHSPSADMAQIHVLPEIFQEAFKVLNVRERTLLSLRFGLEDGFSRTLKQVGKAMKITRERVRQLEKRALKKLEQNNLLASLARKA